METKINVLTEHFFFSFIDSALEMETETFRSENGNNSALEMETFAPGLEN
ncbi:hypothetical protein C1645_839649 [Glomus cerebriforme]|uniref:Uncharacterized protein n=1 Tax=Glomus cerebriforme TaxID=658196 RepID=A0A397S344_9GLOM|nr:hypothetical protein C1645_839649 [Glomus cerebriforme]